MVTPVFEAKEPALKEPGVYVRSTVPDHELDVLWDRERKRHDDHGRSHVGYFAAGCISGTLVTLAACFFFLTGPGLVDQGKPAILEEETLTVKDLPAPKAVQAPKAAPNHGMTIPFLNNKPAEKKPATVTPAIKAETYQVQPGDTLGSIAIHFYHSVSPEYVEKIQRANKLSSPDDLTLGQELTIPPKSY
jgi:LysM repeat protein